MGKKARTKKGVEKAKGRKIDSAQLPEPPPPLEEEIGSRRLLKEPKHPGSLFKVLDADGYDDGGVGDLTLLIDLDDHVLRRKRGEAAFFAAVKSDILPRVTSGKMASMTRRDQKIHLAQTLFSDGEAGVDEDDENQTPSEVFLESTIAVANDKMRQERQERLTSAKHSLRLSLFLREPACAAIALTEISKRYLMLGKEHAEAALRCADKAIEISGEGFYDSDEIAIEAEEEPKLDDKHEKNATSAALANVNSLKYYPLRASVLCLRSAHLHRGNALSALDRHEEARAAYEQILPFLENEPRSARLDWERSSALINIGNTYSRQGDFGKANEYYDQAEQLGKDHLADAVASSEAEGKGLVMVALRSRAFALKKVGKEEEAKQLLRTVLETQKEYAGLKKKEKEALEQTLPQVSPPAEE